MSDDVASVIMAVYDTAPFLRAAVNSVLGQDYPHIELIVVDDGSTDGSREILRSYSDPRIRLLEQDHRGACAAWNLGLACASGRWTNVFDSDDIMPPNYISARVDALRRTGADAVFSRGCVPFVANRPALARAPIQLVACHSACDLLQECASGRFFVAKPSFLAKHELYIQSGGFDESLVVQDDVEFLPRFLGSMQRLAEISGPPWFYRQRGVTMRAIVSRERALGALRAQRKTIDNLRKLTHVEQRVAAQRLFSTCVQCWPLWTEEHRAAMVEAERLRNGEPFDLSCVGGPKARAVAGTLGWRAGRLATHASNYLKRCLLWRPIH